MEKDRGAFDEESAQVFQQRDMDPSGGSFWVSDSAPLVIGIEDFHRQSGSMIDPEDRKPSPWSVSEEDARAPQAQEVDTEFPKRFLLRIGVRKHCKSHEYCKNCECWASEDKKDLPGHLQNKGVIRVERKSVALCAKLG